MIDYGQIAGGSKGPLGSRTWQLFYSRPGSVGVGLLYEVLLCPNSVLELKTLGPTWGEGSSVPPRVECPILEGDLLVCSKGLTLACWEALQL